MANIELSCQQLVDHYFLLTLAFIRVVFPSWKVHQQQKEIATRTGVCASNKKHRKQHHHCYNKNNQQNQKQSPQETKQASMSFTSYSSGLNHSVSSLNNTSISLDLYSPRTDPTSSLSNSLVSQTFPTPLHSTSMDTSIPVSDPVECLELCSIPQKPPPYPMFPNIATV